MTTLIENARLVLPDRVTEPGWLLMGEETILDLGEGSPSAAADRRIDAEGAYLVPAADHYVEFHGGAAGADCLLPAGERA